MTLDIELTELERIYYRVEMPKVRKVISELKAEIGQEGIEHRLSYLTEQESVIKCEIDSKYANYERALKGNGTYLERYITSIRLDDMEKDLRKVKFEIKYLKAALNGKSDINRITPNMIETARQYPIENLIEVKRGKALCPFHEDHNPSMGIKNNRYNCFACGEKGDTINFLMKMEGQTFPEAVKYLTS